MNIEKVGNLNTKSIKKRYFFELSVREKTEQLIREFCDSIGYTEPLNFAWRNIGNEEDLYESGIALRVNLYYEIRYMLISEDFNFWYYDKINPKCIIEDVEPSDNLQPVLLELFKCLAEDFAKMKALTFLDKVDLPSYPGDPISVRPNVDEKLINETLRRF